ncbi:MAG: heme-copper oxidase subunit III [Acidobacteriota bacterium]|nr:heme-copper oxidase subunit III [Acidobacteriota bacterium]
MKVGTAETIAEKKRRLKKISGLSSGLGSNGNKRGGGGGGNNGGNGGDNNKNHDYLGDTERYSSDKFRIGVSFLLLVVLMTFGGLIGAYIVLAANNALEWKPFDLPRQVWISTFLILTSSITYTIAQRFLKSEKQTAAKNWLLATTVLGATFIASQILAWLELVRQGIYVASNPYAGFFYILTMVHALHVIGGICALGYIVLRTWQETDSEEELTKRKSISNAVGWYWHFMDGLWLVLFLLLGFWK